MGENMHCGESNHGFCLLFHTLCTDQVLFPIATDYIFHNKSSTTFPLAQGRQAYWAASSPCLCFPPRDLGSEHVLGLPESSNHSWRDVSLLASQGWPSLWITHLFGVPGAAPPVLASPWPIMALPTFTYLFLYIYIYTYIYFSIFQWKINGLLKSTCGKAHRWTHSELPATP